jgi:hypothetical protein
MFTRHQLTHGCVFGLAFLPIPHPQWRVYFKDLGHWPAPLAARRERFMGELARLPWVIEYCTLHFLAGDRSFTRHPTPV